MPHVCDVEYGITEAFSFNKEPEGNLIKLIILNTAKEILYMPFHAIKQAADYLIKYTKRI